MTETTTHIIKTIAESLGVPIAEVTPTASLAADLNCDSLDTLEFVMALENEIGVEIPDAEIDTWETVQDVINYIEGETK